MPQDVLQNDASAACQRLIVLFERALAVEEKRRIVAEDTIRVPLIPYAIAQMRMRVQPALTPGWPSGDPVHIALVGGTNSGKSTVVNVCPGLPLQQGCTSLLALASTLKHTDRLRLAISGSWHIRRALLAISASVMPGPRANQTARSSRMAIAQPWVCSTLRLV